MLGDFSRYASVTVTPSATTMLSCSNTLGIVPKYVHVTCAADSGPFTANGYVREAWFTPESGMIYTTNGSTGGLTNYAFSPVSETPTQVNTYRLADSTVEIYKGTGSVTGRWHTGTAYTVHFYA